MSQHERRPLGDTERDEERVDHERDDQRQSQDRHCAGAVRHALEPRRKRVEQQQARQKLRLDHSRGVKPRTGKRFPPRFPDEYRDEREAVDCEQDAQDRAEVA